MFSDSILYLSSIFLLFALMGYLYIKFFDSDADDKKINPDYLTGLKYLLNEESDRLVPVEWDVGRSDIFNVRLKVESIDRKGMLREITEVISGLNINIASVDMKVKDALSTAFFIIQINNIKQLDRIINKVIKIPGVDNVERTGL